MSQHGPSTTSVTDAPELAGSEADRAEQARAVDDGAAQDDGIAPDGERIVLIEDDEMTTPHPEQPAEGPREPGEPDEGDEGAGDETDPSSA